jgi:hypothetical protein
MNLTSKLGKHEFGGYMPADQSQQRMLGRGTGRCGEKRPCRS